MTLLSQGSRNLTGGPSKLRRELYLDFQSALKNLINEQTKEGVVMEDHDHDSNLKPLCQAVLSILRFGFIGKKKKRNKSSFPCL